MSDDLTLAISAILGCAIDKFPITYLELPLTISRAKKQDFLPLITQTQNRLAG